MRIATLSATLIGAVLIAACFLTSNAAEAATYKWNNTYATVGSIKVKFCDGTTKTLGAWSGTSKDVCKLWLPFNSSTTAWAYETGTVLYKNKVNCSSGKWLSFTSKTDSKRHVGVSQVKASKCL